MNILEVERNDCISKQAAQNKIKEICNKYGLSYEDGERKPSTGGSAYALGHAFDNLPPVTPQQKTGKWILADEQSKEDTENDNYRFICSECGCSDIHAKGTIVPYCWKCGIKMETEKQYVLPVIPQQETGRWIETNTNEYTCSKCSHCFTLVPEDNRIFQFNYCPHCRTKMEVEK